ncbi:MAG TPA: FAD-dependent oxidoreductase, partial [Luteolibacter sp.]|nr:FAD-dependent oxidoreductase [Luteolibacter sp.]
MKRPAELYQVAVVGGGSAGLAAAVTSARCGARTLFMDRNGFLGGIGTASLVHTFCGLYQIRDEPGAVIANPGFAEEIADRMIRATGRGPVRMGKLDVLPQHPVEFVRIADDLVADEPNIDPRLHTELAGITRDADGWQLRLLSPGGETVVQAACIVDASGDAVTAAFLKQPFDMTPADRLQRPAYVFGIRSHALLDDEARLHTAGLLVEGVKSGALPPDAMGLSFRSSGRDGEIFGTLDLTGGDHAAHYDPLDVACLSLLERRGREVACMVVAWL